uniref:Uncharacterized conserved protein, contains HEPN domain n=1 Tax=Candidatus Kentrum sp. LFY TaxID=2126342 RepID=A0A450WII1_9GAMM|nr:MAG: Uncharacterized conserved protein, contains HEPN domain [Candidatus Kentron sp. LFY]
MSRRDPLVLKDYLEHIRQAIDRIQRYLADVDHAAFLLDEEKQDAVIRNLEIIGEAAGNIQHHFPDFATRHPDFPLRAAYGTRNALAHGYFKVDLGLVWNTIEGDLPLLEIQVEDILQSTCTDSRGIDP